MTLQALIKEKISEKGCEQIAKQLGYSVTKKFEKRVTEVTESPYLALDKSGYDFHYSTAQFIRKLADILGIPKLRSEEHTSELQSR